MARTEERRVLSAAEQDGFEGLLTADMNLRYQQKLASRSIAIVALSTSAWRVIRDNAAPIVAAVDAAVPGSYRELTLPRPPLVRRPYP